MNKPSSSVNISSYSQSPLQNIRFPSLSSDTGSWLYTTLTIIAALLVLEQSVYRYKKRHLPGSSWTIPIIGKFADSLKPTMEGYMKQWQSGELSAVSVFNMYEVPYSLSFAIK
jgi:C-22 sterol desaturase